MTYVIAEPCVGVKDGSCADVCPVDCIHTAAEADLYFIDPDECIDCGVSFAVSPEMSHPTIPSVCFAVEVCTQCKGDLQIPQCKEELQNLSGFTDSSRVTRDPLLFRPNSCETWRRPSKPRRCAHTSHHARCRVMSCEGIGWGRAQIGRQGQARVDPGVSAGIANRSRRFQLGLASSRTQSRVGEVPAVPQCIDDAPFCSSVQSEAARKSGADDRADTWKPRDSPTECKVKLHKQCNRCLQSTRWDMTPSGVSRNVVSREPAEAAL